MTMLTINLPEDLVSRLRAEAAMRHVSLDLYMSELLTEKMSVSDMLDMSVSFDTVLAHVRNAPPRAANHIFPASVSLSDVLRTNIGDSDSDELCLTCR